MPACQFKDAALGSVILNYVPEKVTEVEISDGRQLEFILYFILEFILYTRRDASFE